MAPQATKALPSSEQKLEVPDRVLEYLKAAVVAVVGSVGVEVIVGVGGTANVNEAEVAVVSPDAAALRVTSPAEPLTAHPAKVATPLIGVPGLAVHSDSVPVPLATAKVIGPVAVVAVLPLASWTVNFGWVVRAIPEKAPAGWVVTTILDGAPGLTTNAVVVAPVSEPEDALSV